MPLLHHLYLFLFFLCVLYSSCRIPDDSCRPGDFILLQGDNQVGRKNEALAQKVKFQVVDGAGAPFPNELIGLVVKGRGAILSPFVYDHAHPNLTPDTSDTYWMIYSDGNGMLEFDWILGKDSIQTVTPIFHSGNYCYDSIRPTATATLAPSQRGFFIDTRDNQSYDTVQIGNQIWMAENLNYAYPNSSVAIDNRQGLSNSGRKYTWAEAKVVCPNGWHLPSDAEWKTLELYLGMTQTEVNSFGYDRGQIAGQLKAVVGWEAYNYQVTTFSGLNGSNSTGFNAYPTYSPESNYGVGTSEYFWTATDSIYRILTSIDNGIGRENRTDLYYPACRCVKD